MSRIAGIYTGNGEILRSAARAMLPSMAADSWIGEGKAAGRAWLGWTGWHTPGVAEEGGLTAVLDGFIYNRDDLGVELAEGDSDATILVRLVLRHGFDGALDRINGDFAAAVYDEAGDTLLLGRDRLGIRPLYYASGPGFFAFASRPRPLLGLPGVSAEPDRRFLAVFAGSHYRYFDNEPESSPYRDIRQLPAGRMLRLRGGRPEISAYWRLREEPDFAGDEAALAEEYRELLLDSVRLRLEAARRPAFTLSGGMDSSSVLASAVRLSGERQTAFSTVYEDATYDESNEIRSMLDLAVRDWRTVKIGVPDVFDLVERMIEANDEPVATATWLSHFLLCQETARLGYGGLFGGLGGDELNAGEYEHYFYHFADLRRAGREDDLASEVAAWARHHDHPIYRKNMAVVEDAFKRLVDLSVPGRCLPDRARLARYAGAVNPELFELERYEPAMDHPFSTYLKNRTFQDTFRETSPCCLRAEDRQTQAFGLDNFLPFFDHRLVEFMFRIPGDMKIRGGVSKWLLRRAMKGVLPEETRTRIKKTGWNAPAHIWFSGRGRERLMDMVRSRSFHELGIYRPAEVERLIIEHEEIVKSGQPRENHMMFLWQLANLSLWLLKDSRRAAAA